MIARVLFRCACKAACRIAAILASCERQWIDGVINNMFMMSVELGYFSDKHIIKVNLKAQKIGAYTCSKRKS